MTSSNFSGFDEYPLEDLIDLPFGICEMAADSASVVTKHKGTKGHVNVDLVKAQLLLSCNATSTSIAASKLTSEISK